MCVCMCVYVHVCVYVCVYMCVCVFMCVYVCVCVYIYVYVYVCVYTGCPRRNDFGRVFLMLEYTDITQNTYIQS
jgi:hypothetical protein